MMLMELRRVYDGAVVSLVIGGYRSPLVKNQWKGVVKPVTGYTRLVSDSSEVSTMGECVLCYEERSRSYEGAPWSEWTTVRADAIPLGGLYLGPASNPTPHRFPALPSLSQWQSAEADIAAKALRAGLDLGTFLAELKPTLKMIASLQGDVIRKLRAFRQAHSTLKEAGDSWLAYRYGVVPLLSDMEELLKILDGRYEQLFRVSGGSSYGTMPPPISVGGSGSMASSLMPLPPAGHVRTPPSWSSTLTCRAFTSTIRSGAGVLCQGNGVYVNPVLTAWELVPYSFVVDWVLNVGDSLAVVFPTFGRSIAFSWGTARAFSVEELVATPVHEEGSDYWVQYPTKIGRCVVDNQAVQRFISNQVSFRRMPFGNDPTVSLTADIKLTWQRLVDALFLSAQKKQSLHRLLSFRR